MGKSKSELPNKQQTTHPRLSKDTSGLSYVRVDEQGRIIAVFSDDSEMNVSELFSSSMKDD